MHRKANKTIYKGHVEELASSVSRLADMERLAQDTFLKMKSDGKCCIPGYIRGSNFVVWSK